MQTFEVKIPDSLNIDKMQFAMFVASGFYKQGKLSLGQAAEMAGLSKRAFIELLASYNVSVFNYDVSELKNDVANA
jgi:predicted HTH domain antitoxin